MDRPTPPTEILVQNESFLALMAQAMEGTEDRIQGFHYAGHHVIRDLGKPRERQEIWRRAGEYEATHAAMLQQLEIERLRLAVQRAFAMAERPWPGQEADAAQVRAVLDAFARRIATAHQGTDAMQGGADG